MQVTKTDQNKNVGKNKNIDYIRSGIRYNGKESNKHDKKPVEDVNRASYLVY